MASPSAEFWLKSVTTLPAFTAPPAEQYVAELLANAPWSGWSTGETPFHWEYVDRPEGESRGYKSAGTQLTSSAAGAALISFLHPPHRPPPSDGLRYLPSNPPERSSITTHLVSAPVSGLNPTLVSQVTVELETLTMIHGHWPPTSRNSGLLPDSPEMRLSRFRKRYRIRAGAGHPGLWLSYWGKDDNGGAGGGGAPNAPAGWEREPIRAYPLPKDAAPTDPVLIFGGRNRPPTGGPGMLPGFSAPGALPTSAPLPNRPQPQSSFPPPLPNAFQPYARQQQHLGPLPSQPSHQALQSQYLLQQQHHATQQALAHQQAQAAYSASLAQQQGVPPPYSLQAAQLLAHQQANAAAQAQAQAHAQQQQQQAQMMQAQKLATRTSQGRTKVAEEEMGDILDTVSARQVAEVRMARNHELLAGVLDPWRVAEVWEGKKRRREEVGRGARGGLTELAGGGKEGVEDRREKLRTLLERTEREVEEMQRAHEEKIRGLGRRISVVGMGARRDG